MEMMIATTLAVKEAAIPSRSIISDPQHITLTVIKKDLTGKAGETSIMLQPITISRQTFHPLSLVS